jgi:hypothetical protein
MMHVRQENNPPSHHAHSSFPMKSLKALKNLTPLKKLECNSSKLRLPHMVVSIWLTCGDHLRAIQLNRMDLESLVFYGTSHLYPHENKPHVHPNWSWFGPIATQYPRK